MAVPTAVISDGALKVVWVPTIGNVNAPTVAELNATGTVDLSCYLTDMTTGTNEQSVTDDRLCSRQTFERPGRYTDSLDWTYVYQGQGTPTDNLAFTTLRYLTSGYVVCRWGMANETAFAAAQKVDVMPAQNGRQVKNKPAANETLKVTQKVFLTAAIAQDVAVAA